MNIEKELQDSNVLAAPFLFYKSNDVEMFKLVNRQVSLPVYECTA